MLLRELTTDIRPPLNEFDILGGLKWLGGKALGGPASAIIGALTPSPAGAYSDMSPASQIYNSLIAQGKDRGVADAAAKEFNQRIAKGPTPELLKMFQNITGSTEVPFEFKGMTAPVAPNDVVAKPNDAPKELPVTQPRDGGNPGGVTTAITPKVTPKAPVKPKQTGQDNNPNAGDGGGIPPAVANLPNIVKDEGAASALANSNPQTASQWADGISKVTGGNVNPSTIQNMSNMAVKYALPAAAVVALLYGGKKLIDYLRKDKKRKLNVN